MKINEKPHGFRQQLSVISSTLRHNPHLWQTPKYVGWTLLISGVSMGYYYIYRAEKVNRESDIYKESIRHLESYTPAHAYIGTPYKLRRIKETSIDDESVIMVVPISGPKAQAKLHIFGKRGESNKLLLDHLDIEIKSQDKRWTFFCPSVDTQSNKASQVTDTTDSLRHSVTVTSEGKDSDRHKVTGALQACEGKDFTRHTGRGPFQTAESISPLVDVKLAQKG
ncbi:uncharacterized protein [Watersipora subatra]|uniref:uncharacterized protein n=1 Tax=Watersipora subatra TaxID=2589382 RepID=UPI00355C70D4